VPFDLRATYTFDASESQILEGQVSPYGPGNSHANCFDGRTEVITKAGIKSIGDLAGHYAVLLSRKGKWVRSPVSSFGLQPLTRVILGRQGAEKEIYATPDHRWFAEPHRGGRDYSERLTSELAAGDRLQTIHGGGGHPKDPASPFGIAHGIMFGDGSGERLPLVGDNRELATWFPLNLSHEWRGQIVVSGLPHAWKEPPSLTESPPYLRGWLMGYFAADGTCTTTGVARLSSTRLAHLLAARDVAARLGIGTMPIRASVRIANLTGKGSTLYTLNLVRSTLTPSFFLRSHHRQRFEATPPEGFVRDWRVLNVEPTYRRDEVFCAVVPEERAFVLADNVITGNCVPSSFTAALAMAGYPDIDPQQITDDVYGPNYRGGYGNFEKALTWIAANVPNAPSWNHGAFDFDVAEAAGEAAKLIVIAGWIDAPSVSFVGVGGAHGFSHASLLAAHLDDDTFVIWNVWLGKFQTYSRDVMAASLYEMAVMETTSGGDFMSALTDQQQTDMANGIAFLVARLGGDPQVNASLTADVQALWGRLATGDNTGSSITADLQAIAKWMGYTAGGPEPDISGALTSIKTELDQLMAHPAVVGSDPQVLELLQQVRSKFS
jgi:hypothetical protein